MVHLQENRKPEEEETMYNNFEHAKITVKHLDSNSASHTHPFSAIFELVDNSYDADSKNLKIDFVDSNGTQRLEFLDDGSGMSRSEALQVLSFGHSNKAPNQIGRYGNGLKSGAFYLGREVLIITKKDKIQTVMLISNQFFDDSGIESQVLVPCPSFDQNGLAVFSTQQEVDRYPAEMEIIKKYAPPGLKTTEDLLNQIEGETGTYIVIYKLKKSVLGELTFNVSWRLNDIAVDKGDNSSIKSSLRRSLENLYLYPKMQIRLRGEIVVPRKICESWMAKREVEISTRSFKNAFCKNNQARQESIAECQEKIGQINSQFGELNTSGLRLAELKSKRRPLNNALDAANKHLAELKKQNDEAKKNFKDEKIVFKMGVQIKKRMENGIHFYINNRRIVSGYKKMFFSRNPNALGVSGYVNLTSNTFRPSLSKTMFESADDFNCLAKKCEDYLAQYFNYFQHQWIPRHLLSLEMNASKPEIALRKFWKFYGYESPLNPLSEQKQVLNANVSSMIVKQCSSWRLCQLCSAWKTHDSLEKVDKLSFKCIDLGMPCSRSAASDNEGFRELPEGKRITPAQRETPRLPSRSSSRLSQINLVEEKPVLAPPSPEVIVLEDDTEDEINFDRVDEDRYTASQSGSQYEGSPPRKRRRPSSNVLEIIDLKTKNAELERKNDKVERAMSNLRARMTSQNKTLIDFLREFPSLPIRIPRRGNDPNETMKFIIDQIKQRNME
uniref:CW-type domain-containing protein n=1 Tax=Caenorhabditis tropicalis TaxID=1561998 RepID=A0A1I7UPK1_9PELO